MEFSLPLGFNLNLDKNIIEKGFFLPRVFKFLVKSEIKKTFLRTCESDTHIRAI